MVNYAYDDANRLTSVNGQAYTWDDNGNLLNDGLRSYSYDHANRLTQVVSGTLTTEFAYNGAGDRVAKTVDGVTTDYVLDPATGFTQVLQETTASQATSYLYGADLLAQYDSGTWAYHINDGLGSVRQLADPAGQVVQSYSFSPFGVPLGESGGEPYGYTGEQWDASTGLVFLRARYYQPEVGRFISKDPFPGYPLEPISLQLYIYANDNPLKYVDPTGHQGVNESIAKWLRDKAESCYQADNLQCVWCCYLGLAVGGPFKGYPHASEHLLQFLYKKGDIEYNPPASDWVRDSGSVQAEIPLLEQELLANVQMNIEVGEMSGHIETRHHSVVSDQSTEGDLYYAMNIFELWAEADYKGTEFQNCIYTVRVRTEYYFFDEYDWHKGLVAGGGAAGVSGFEDEWAAALHDAQIAEEFEVRGHWPGNTIVYTLRYQFPL